MAECDVNPQMELTEEEIKALIEISGTELDETGYADGVRWNNNSGELLHEQYIEELSAKFTGKLFEFYFDFISGDDDQMRVYAKDGKSLLVWGIPGSSTEDDMCLEFPEFTEDMLN